MATMSEEDERCDGEMLPVAQWWIRSCFCGMFSHSVMFSNINTEQRLFGTFSVVSWNCRFPPVFIYKSIFSSLHVSLFLFLFSCLMSKRNSNIFLIVPHLLSCVCSIFLSRCFVFPLFCHVSLVFFLPLSSSSALICPNILPSLQAPFHLFPHPLSCSLSVSAPPFPLSWLSRSLSAVILLSW